MLIEWLSGARLAADPLLILLAALVFDAAVGDPAWLYRAVPHPVALLGRLIAAGEARANDLGHARPVRILRGALMSAAITIGAGALGWVIEAAVSEIPGGWLIEATLASTLIAGRGLYDHVLAVAKGLERGLSEARAAVGRIVGRDPDSQDRAGVARAGVESLAENFSDAVVAPVFWFALLGLGGLLAYKAVNTLDSMIGHRSDRYEAFGKAAARLDDALNWAPARLAGLVIVAAAAVLPGADAPRAWRTMRRDAPRHRSPNAGWQEAAMAGALAFALAGPRRYGEDLVEDHWMGDGRRDLSAADLGRALKLYLAANGVLAGALAVLAIV